MFRSHRNTLGTFAALAAAVLCAIAACTTAPSDSTINTIGDKPATPEQRVASERTVLPPGQPAASQETFPTPDAAVVALVTACESGGHADMNKIFGPANKDFVTGDPVEDANDFAQFAQSTSEGAMLEEKSPTVAILYIGKENWPFPIPIAKTNDGKWYFDTVAGETEILARRIGSNELEAIALCHDYVDAQREYAYEDRDGDGVLQYAQRILSHPGQKDGLYWPAGANQADAEPSPFGEFIADAAAEGYEPISGSKKTPSAYHGYYIHILNAQGPDAPGGAYSYIINGKMIAGFALVAYPAEYGKSGMMTFIVSHNGKVYQKDLGPGTTDAAMKMTQYNPDKSWSLIKK